MLQIQLPWYTQPDSALARPEWLRCFNFLQGPGDVDGRVPIFDPMPALARQAGPAGLFGAHWVTTEVSSTTGAIVDGISAGVTIVFVAEHIATTATNNFLFGESSASTGTYNYGFYEDSGDALRVFVHNGSTGVSATATGWGGAQAPQVWVGTYGDGDNNVRVYLNGVQNAAAAQTGTIQRSSTAHLSMQRWNVAGSNMRVYAAAVQGRRLSADEIAERFRSLETTWDALFEPRLIWVPQSAATGVTGTSATTNANDTSSASGTTTIVGTSSTINANDTSSASGSTTVIGTSATTNANDTSTASGSVGAVTGTSATTNANDLSSASGTTTITGSSATTNANDTSTASGWVGVVTGTSATTNANDISTASGTTPGPPTTFSGGQPMPGIYGPPVRKVLLNAVTATGAGGAVKDIGNGNWPTFQASIAGTGAVSATILIQARNVENGAWSTLFTLSPSGTTTASATNVATGRYMEYQADCTAISGTGATLSVAMAG